MLNRNLLGIVVSVVIAAGVMMCGVNLANADEETPKTEGTHKMSDKATAPEHEYGHVERPMCPSCGKVRVGAEKGRTVAKMVMECPDCKNKVSEFDVHHCDQCEKDVLICTMCNKISAELKAEATEAKCPTCKEVRTRPIKGIATAKWAMKCPDCKKETAEWLTQHCDKCDKDFLACPICKSTPAQ